MAIGLNRFAFRSTILVIEFMKTIPVIAILPLLLLQYGGSLKMEYLLVAFGVFWPLVIQVVYGVRSIDPVARDTAEALRVTGPRRLWLIVLPAATPFIATGLRIAGAVALIIAIIAELIGGASGLGRDILLAQNSGTSALPLVYALVVITGALGIADLGHLRPGRAAPAALARALSGRRDGSGLMAHSDTDVTYGRAVRRPAWRTRRFGAAPTRRWECSAGCSAAYGCSRSSSPCGGC